MTGVRLLVVEDEEIIAQDIASQLRAMGYVVVATVPSGEKAIATATTAHPDLVLMDIVLRGEMDGIEAAQQIRSSLQIPVVYLTANAESNTLRRAKLSDPFGYILKPFREEELRVAIELALARYQTEQEIQKALNPAPPSECEPSPYSPLAIASHEFRTPLAVIQRSAALLQQSGNTLSEEKKQQYLQHIQAATQSMNQLLEEILMLETTTRKDLILCPQWFNLVAFCQEILQIFQLQGDNHSITFTSSCPVLEVYLDNKLLWHILSNLLSNAVKYSPPGSAIHCTLEQEQDSFRLQITDPGIGISPEDINWLFEPFQRGSNVGQIPGTGLGLAILKASLNHLGGQITVQSQLGQGSCFAITLPLQYQGSPTL